MKFYLFLRFSWNLSFGYKNSMYYPLGWKISWKYSLRLSYNLLTPRSRLLSCIKNGRPVNKTLSTLVKLRERNRPYFKHTQMEKQIALMKG